jgi:hypothetical protein
MSKIELRIVINAEQVPTIFDIYEIILNMKARLDGYHTEVPKLLETAIMNFSGKYCIDGEEKDIFDEIKKIRE